MQMFIAVGYNQITFQATRSTAWVKLEINKIIIIIIIIMNWRHRHGLLLMCPAVLLEEGRPDTRERRKSSIHLPHL